MSGENVKLEGALAYADLGVKVFPANVKVPLIKGGVHSASIDPEQIKAWWKLYPNANIGASMEGMLALDDDSAGEWKLTEEQKESLYVAPTSITPRGGFHAFFKLPKGKKWGNWVGLLAPKVDTRTGPGGYCILPPSDGYKWVPGNELDVAPNKLTEPPQWLCGLLDKVGSRNGKPEAREDGACESGAIPDGVRNASLTSMAGTMRRVGMSPKEMEAALQVVNEDRCEPPIGKGEVKAIAGSVARYEPDQAAVAVTEHYWDMLKKDGKLTLPEDPKPFPTDRLRIPGFMSELMDFTLRTAPYPNTPLAFAGALACLSLLSGRKVADSADNRTNHFILALAHSGAGKDHPRKVNQRLLTRIGIPIGGLFASAEGIEDILYTHYAYLFQTDEINTMIQAISQGKDIRFEQMMAMMLQLYSAANSVYPMRIKAGPQEDRIINQPHFTLLGTAVPECLYKAICPKMMMNGFLPRFLLLQQERRGSGQEPVIEELPERIVETSGAWKNMPFGDGNLSAENPRPRIVPFSADGAPLLREIREYTEKEYDRWWGVEESKLATWARAYEHIRKLALTYAVSENMENPIITKTAIQWSADFILQQTAFILGQIGEHMPENPFDGECLKVIATLKKSKGYSMPHSPLLKRSKTSAQDFDKVIRTLMERGQVKVERKATAGREARIYHLVAL